MTLRSLALSASLLSVILTGCALLRKEPPPRLDISARTYPVDGSRAVRRVLFLPFANQTEYRDQEKVAEKAFAEACARRRLFEIVLPPPEAEKHLRNCRPSRDGTFPATLLVELATRYKVDAVLVGTLKLYDPFAPPILGIKADLISVYDGAVLRSMDGVLDARDRDVIRDIDRYCRDACSASSTLFDDHLVVTSPEMFARYACDRMVGAMFPEQKPASKG